MTVLLNQNLKYKNYFKYTYQSFKVVFKKRSGLKIRMKIKQESVKTI